MNATYTTCLAFLTDGAIFNDRYLKETEVLLKFKEDISEAQINHGFALLASLKDKVSGMLDYKKTEYCSNEGMNDGFIHGFEMVFDTTKNRDI